MSEAQKRGRRVTRKAGAPKGVAHTGEPEFRSPAESASGTKKRASKSSQKAAKKKTAQKGQAQQNNAEQHKSEQRRHVRNVVKSMQGSDLTQPLDPPPAAPRGGLRIYALGGISEIGRNMTVFEYNRRIIIVDCGVLFPSSDEPGVDLILPDFGPLEKHLDRIDGLFITHGHEDHIGAIPWLLKLRGDIPIYASPFTAALIQAKCQEHRQRPKIIPVNEDSSVDLGPFNVRFWHVGHSIPDCLGLAIKTKAGLVIHTGDIKLDQTPTDGRPTDLPALSRFGDEGVTLMLCDSTNATTPGFSGSEAEIAPTLKRLVADASQRVIVASFASNVYRVQAAVDAAVAAGRKVAFSGRSMIRNMDIAERMGFLKAPRGTIISIDDAAKMAPHKVMLITTGTQGEPMAALSRMSRKEHRQITVRDGDLIILSSSLVPGNEEAVFGVINNLAQIGATVVTSKDAKVHTSGHGYSGELLFLWNAARPRNAMPVHGEWRHLRANKQLAISTGVKEENTVLAQNGVVVDLVNGRANVVGQIPVGNLYVDGVRMGDVDADVLADRTSLSENGLIAITAVINSRSGRLMEHPRVETKGFTEDAHDMVTQVAELAENLIEDLAAEGENDPYRMVRHLRRKVGKFISQTWRRDPIIMPTVVPMSPSTVSVIEDDEVKSSRESL